MPEMTFYDHVMERSFYMIDETDEFGYVDWEEEVITFPLWNLSGQLIGYQVYRWKEEKIRDKNAPMTKQKYFTYLPKGVTGVYGLHLLQEGYLGQIFIVEGIWEAIYGWGFGLPCVAVLGANPKILRNWINSIPNDVVVLAQPDSAGQKLKKFSKSPPVQLEGDLDDCLRNRGWFGIPTCNEEGYMDWYKL